MLIRDFQVDGTILGLVLGSDPKRDNRWPSVRMEDGGLSDYEGPLCQF